MLKYSSCTSPLLSTFPVAAPVLLPGIAVDGKTVRGAARPDGAVPYLAG